MQGMLRFMHFDNDFDDMQEYIGEFTIGICVCGCVPLLTDFKMVCRMGVCVSGWARVPTVRMVTCLSRVPSWELNAHSQGAHTSHCTILYPQGPCHTGMCITPSLKCVCAYVIELKVCCQLSPFRTRLPCRWVSTLHLGFPTADGCEERGSREAWAVWTTLGPHSMAVPYSRAPTWKSQLVYT